MQDRRKALGVSAGEICKDSLKVLWSTARQEGCQKERKNEGGSSRPLVGCKRARRNETSGASERFRTPLSGQNKRGLNMRDQFEPDVGRAI